MLRIKSNSPSWVKNIKVDYDSDIGSTIAITLYDRMKGKEANLGEVIAFFNNTSINLNRELDSGGRLHVGFQDCENIIDGTLRLQLRGLDIVNVEHGFLGLGVSDPFF